jgi:hypothetical protein
MKSYAPIIHNSIERDSRLHWHPIVEVRHKGVLIYMVTAVKGHLQQAQAAAQGMRETEAILRG